MESMQKENKEILNPERVYIVSPISMPKYGISESDTIRGNLAIDNLKKANELGYSVILIYGDKENEEFLRKLKEVETSGNNKIVIKKQDEYTYSGARRDAIRQAIENSNCEVIVMYEIEKPIDEIPAMVEPILSGRADITVTDRQIVADIKSERDITNDPEKPNENLRGLPWYQARSEKYFCNWANEFLTKMKIKSSDSPNIDWMGNRAWRNTNKVNSFFLARYVEDIDRRIFDDIKPDHLSSSLFFPMIEIFRSYPEVRLESVPINYKHDRVQSDFENKEASFIVKRDNQRKMLIHEMMEYVRQVLGQRSSVKRVG